MNIDDSSMYVFIRQDLPDWQQLCHSNHAMFEMARKQGATMPNASDNERLNELAGHPNVILVGVKDQDALKEACEDLRQREVGFFAWSDPDAPQLGLLSLATGPLSKRDKNKLHSYRAWERKNNTFGKGAPKA